MASDRTEDASQQQPGGATLHRTKEALGGEDSPAGRPPTRSLRALTGDRLDLLEPVLTALLESKTFDDNIH